VVILTQQDAHHKNKIKLSLLVSCWSLSYIAIPTSRLCHWHNYGFIKYCISVKTYFALNEFSLRTLLSLCYRILQQGSLVPSWAYSEAREHTQLSFKSLFAFIAIDLTAWDCLWMVTWSSYSHVRQTDGTNSGLPPLIIPPKLRGWNWRHTVNS
jgi:hypothetical protein